MQNESLASQVQLATRHYESAFNGPPKWIVAAPGRVNLMGEHVDYNNGLVLPMAIERYTVIAAAENRDIGAPLVTFRSHNLQRQFTWDMSQPIKPGKVGWQSYVEGVIAGFGNLGHSCGGFNAVVTSSVPIGGGLSSSAALEVATATLMEMIIGIELKQKQKALLCQKAEHEFAGVPCGVMDQFSSVFGQKDQLMLIDCRSHEIEFVPFSSRDVTVLITNCNVRHELASSRYTQRRQQCEEAATQMGIPSLREATLESLEACHRLDPTIYKRGKHVITEIERTKQTAQAIQSREWKNAGQLMYASHKSMRDDFEISCPEIDCLVELAEELGESQGVYGSRLTGGGFGGCSVSLVQVDKVVQIAEAIGSRYREVTNVEPSFFSSRPAAGAHWVNPDSV